MKRLVYIDTSEFVSANFAFTASRLATAVSRAKAGQIEIGVPPITHNEVLAQIDKSLHQAENALGAARKDAKLLRNVDGELSQALFDDFDTDAYRAIFRKNWEQFLEDAKAIDLKYQDADIARVFDLYFSEMPPFSGGKKKNEFPDAFILSVLNAWGESEGREVLVATSDKDMEDGVKAFGMLRFAGKLEQLLDQVTKEFDQLALTAEGAIQALEQQIEAALCANFQGLGFVLDDQNGDVTDVTAQEASFASSLLGVSDIGDGYCEAIFDLTGAVGFEAALEYDDMDTAVWDHEDKVYSYLESKRETVKRNEPFQATVKIVFAPDDKTNLDFELTWGSPKDVSVSSSASDAGYM